MPLISTKDLIESLGLEGHDEGGYFRQIHQSDWTIETKRAGNSRYGLNTIYYLLTADSPQGHLHRNQSDITHFFHAGGPIRYLTVSPTGVVSEIILGPNPDEGHVFQMTVPGGFWKASALMSGPYGLISEAVAPGFDYRDRELATPEAIQALFPTQSERLKPLILSH
ncbi:cupin domain-containing protein [Vampirovibrio sp.]|uniref:cupin domain-containing protein n=1 Tax=Vampirovibrio sp. TaxID=2717857 RepID=UPI003593F1CD